MKRTNRKYPSSYVKAAKENFDSNKVYLSSHSTDARILTELAYDQDLGIKRNVAHNPATPVEVLDYLANDIRLAWSIAANRNTPSEILTKVARMLQPNTSEQCGAAVTLAKNPNTPSRVITELVDRGFSIPGINYNDPEDRFDIDILLIQLENALHVPSRLASTILDWYISEGALDDFDTADDFINFVQDDIYDMLDACTDAELRKEIGSYLGVDYDEDEDF